MSVGAKSETSAWDQLAATPNHDHPIRQQQLPSVSPPAIKPPTAAPATDAKPPEYGEELHPELVSIKFAISRPDKREFVNYLFTNVI